VPILHLLFRRARHDCGCGYRSDRRTLKSQMSSKTILIIEQFADQYRARISAAYPEADVRTVSCTEDVGERIADVQALFGFGPSFDDDLIRRAAKLEWVQFLSSGTDALSRLPSLRPEVVVTSCYGVHGPSVSEMVFLHMLTLARNYALLRRNQDDETWEEFDQVLLHGKTIVIVGTGLIASALAGRCKAFGMTVIGVTQTPRSLQGFDRMFHRSQLKDATSLADFLVLIAPLTTETKGLIDAAVLNAMKPSAYLINVGRGATCDEAALVSALREKRIAGAGLDAFSIEPLPKGHPLWKMSNVTITPHVAGRNDRYADLVMPILLHNLKCYSEGQVAEMMNIKKPPFAARV
jgi:D-2-hydroxyacid dehydrogenase (NADP+)